MAWGVSMLVVLLIVLVVALGGLKWMGMRAMSWRYIEVSGLTAEQIADIDPAQDRHRR